VIDTLTIGGHYPKIAMSPDGNYVYVGANNPSTGSDSAIFVLGF
jgi:hypothetical protein